MSLRLTIIAGLLVSGLACNDSTSPHGKLSFLASGDTLTGAVTSKTPASYRTAIKAGNQLVVYLDAGTNVLMTVLSSTGVAVGFANGTGDLTGASTFGVVLPRATTDATYDIEIAVAPNDLKQESYRLRARTIDPQPEHASSAISIGTMVTDSIDYPADIDEYTFTATAGQQLEIYLQQLQPAAPSGVLALLQADGTLNFAGGGASSTAADSDLEAHASGLITIPTTGRYRLVVQPPRSSVPAYVGGYRFEIVAIDSLPEHASPTLTVGDTIANESIDHVGDVDVFTLAGAPGTDYNIFIEAGGGPPHTVIADVVGHYELTTTAIPGGLPLLQNASGRFTMPASGSVTIRVHDANTGSGVYRGPYRLFVKRIDHAPEGTAPLITAGAPVTSALEVPGDIDEYSLTLSAPITANMLLTRGADATGGTLQVQLGGTGAYYDPIYDLPSTSTALASSHLDLAPGTYKFTVSGTSSRGDGYRGSYQLELRPVNPAPESVPARVAIGDTVRGESLEYAGDIDTFMLSVAAGDTFNIKLATPGRTNSGIYIYLLDPATHIRFGGSESQSGRLEPDPGVYQVVVSAENDGAIITQAGAYELAIERVSARPEHHQASIAYGDTVRDEHIDYVGDYDDFVLHGPPGQEIYATFQWVPDGSLPYSSGSGSLAILDSASGAILGGTPSYGAAQFTKRVTMPDNGVVRVRVQGLSNATGGYWFTVQPVNRAPESRAPAFSLGDTVADAIEPPMDVDEFTFSAVAGQSVDVFFQAPNGLSSPYFSGLQLDVIDQTTGAIVASLTDSGYTPNLEDINRRGVILPSTGSYLVRVQSMPDQQGEGNYRFRIAVSP